MIFSNESSEGLAFRQAKHCFATVPTLSRLLPGICQAYWYNHFTQYSINFLRWLIPSGVTGFSSREALLCNWTNSFEAIQQVSKKLKLINLFIIEMNNSLMYLGRDFPIPLITSHLIINIGRQRDFPRSTASQLYQTFWGYYVITAKLPDQSISQHLSDRSKTLRRDRLLVPFFISSLFWF